MTTKSAEGKTLQEEMAEGNRPEPKRILIADDEHLVASGLAASLSDLNFEVIGPAADGERAIELCREDAPDIALLDIQMPEDGRAQCGGSDLPRVRRAGGDLLGVFRLASTSRPGIGSASSGTCSSR